MQGGSGLPLGAPCHSDTLTSGGAQYLITAPHQDASEGTIKELSLCVCVCVISFSRFHPHCHTLVTEPPSHSHTYSFACGRVILTRLPPPAHQNLLPVRLPGDLNHLPILAVTHLPWKSCATLDQANQNKLVLQQISVTFPSVLLAVASDYSRDSDRTRSMGRYK